MVVYLCAFILTLIFSYLYVKKCRPVCPIGGVSVENNPKNAKTEYGLRRLLYFIVAVFPIWFITAFRFDVGTDYSYTYVKFFELTQLGQQPYNEWLFQLLNNLLVELGLSYVWLFAVCGAVINVITFKLIFDHSANPLYSIAIYFCSAIFFNTLNNVRQYVAIAIAVLAFFKDKNWKSLLIIAVACLFHSSAVLFFVFFILSKIRLNKTQLLVFSLILLVVSPLAVLLLKDILSETRYSYFIGYSTGYSLMTVLINLGLTFLTLVYYDEKDKKFRMLAIMQLLSFILCIWSMIMQNEEFWMRLIRMPSFLQIILVPQILKNVKSSFTRNFLGLCILGAYSFYTIYTVIIMGGLEVLPYQFVF